MQGEAYKLFWPDQPEFVRMAARFGVTIIPFGFVGEDDVLEVNFHLFLLHHISKIFKCVTNSFSEENFDSLSKKGEMLQICL